jgi:hypothetical protein
MRRYLVTLVVAQAEVGGLIAVCEYEPPQERHATVEHIYPSRFSPKCRLKHFKSRYCVRYSSQDHRFEEGRNTIEGLQNTESPDGRQRSKK